MLLQKEVLKISKKDLGELKKTVSLIGLSDNVFVMENII
jgi:hypothetical protein